MIAMQKYCATLPRALYEKAAIKCTAEGIIEHQAADPSLLQNLNIVLRWSRL